MTRPRCLIVAFSPSRVMEARIESPWVRWRLEIKTRERQVRRSLSQSVVFHHLPRSHYVRHVAETLKSYVIVRRRVEMRHSTLLPETTARRARPSSGGCNGCDVEECPCYFLDYYVYYKGMAVSKCGRRRRPVL